MKKAMLVFAGFAALAVLPAAARSTDETSLATVQCVADNDSRSVTKLLNSLPGSADETRAATQLLELYGPCASDSASSRGAFAWRDRAELAYIVARERLGGKRPAAGSVSATWTPVLAPGLVAGRDYDLSSVGMLQLGACVARAAPDAAIALVASAPGSAEEKIAIAALRPALGPCIPTGKTFQLGRADLRFLVAEPVYHAVKGG